MSTAREGWTERIHSISSPFRRILIKRQHRLYEAALFLLSDQFVQDFGHLGNGFSVSGFVPVQNHGHNAADVKKAALVSIVGLRLVQDPELALLLGDIYQHPFHQQHGKIILAQCIQKGMLVFPVLEKPFINDVDRLSVSMSGQVEGCTVKDRVIQKGIETAFLAAEIAVEGFAGDPGQVTDMADGDLGILAHKHQFQQTAFQLPLAAGAFFGCTMFIHNPPKSSNLLYIS